MAIHLLTPDNSPPYSGLTRTCGAAGTRRLPGAAMNERPADRDPAAARAARASSRVRPVRFPRGGARVHGPPRLRGVGLHVAAQGAATDHHVRRRALSATRRPAGAAIHQRDRARRGERPGGPVRWLALRAVSAGDAGGGRRHARGLCVRRRGERRAPGRHRPVRRRGAHRRRAIRPADLPTW